MARALKKKFLYYFIFFTIFFILLYLFFSKQSRIKRIHTLQEFAQAIDSHATQGKKNLILIDIDDTLEKSGDVAGFAFDPLFDAAVHKKLQKKFPHLNDEELKKKLQYYQSIEWTTEDKALVEPSSAALIDKLKKDGNIVLALTSTPPGRYYKIDNFPSWRYAILKKMGVVFSQDLGNAVLTELHKKPYPELYNGMIFGGEWSKGDVLKAFFAHFPALRKQIDTIFFLDDDIVNHEHVDRATHDLTIPFQGFHYTFVRDHFTGWQDAAHAHLTDTYFKRGLKQWDYLLEHGTWLKDNEIDAVRCTE